MSYKIHAFFCASCVLGFGISHQKDAKSSSSFVRVFKVQRGSRVYQPRHLVCYLRVVLQRHPKIMHLYEFCLGSCAQDRFHKGQHLPPHTNHNPCTHVSTPKASAQKEVHRHVFQYRRRQSRYNLLVPLHLLWHRKIIIGVYQHQKFGSSGELSKSCDDAINIRGVVGGEVTSNDVPSPLPRCQLKDDNFVAKLPYYLHREPQGRLVEHRHSSVVSAQSVHSNGAVAGWPAGADSIRNLGFLEGAQVQVGLGHTPRCRLQSSVLAVLYVVQFEPNGHPGFTPFLFPLPPLCSLPILPHITYQWRSFIHAIPSLLLPVLPILQPLPSSISPVLSYLIRSHPITVLFQSPNNALMLFTLAWSIP